MGRLVVLLALVACGRGQAGHVAWPQPSTTAEDGGESIAPREPSKMTAAADKTDEPAETKPTATPIATPTVGVETPAASAPAATPPVQEDILINDEIIIEIDD